jgi:anti-anti-sigma factor
MLEVHARENVIVFTGHGEWDLACADALRAQFSVAVSGCWAVTVVDLSDVSFLDLAGASPIEQLIASLTPTGRHVALLHPRPAVTRLLEILGLADYVVPVEELPRVPDLPDLLSALPVRHRLSLGQHRQAAMTLVAGAQPVAALDPRPRQPR